MGNSLEAYKLAIDMFYNCSRISYKCVLVQADSHRNILLTNLWCSFLFVSLFVLQSLNPNVNVVFLLFVLHFILMIGNVELNPGPETDLSSSPLKCKSMRKPCNDLYMQGWQIVFIFGSEVDSDHHNRKSQK